MLAGWCINLPGFIEKYYNDRLTIVVEAYLITRSIGLSNIKNHNEFSFRADWITQPIFRAFMMQVPGNDFTEK